MIRKVGVAAVLGLALQAAFASVSFGPASWGSADQPWGTRRQPTPSDRALIASYRSGGKPITYSADFKNPDQFKSEWTLQKDEKRGLKSCRREENVEAIGQGLRLKTLAATDCEVQWSTGAVVSNFKQKYGFFEARMKIGDITGMNNSFWLKTTDDYEIDVTEFRLPNYDHMNLCNWDKSIKSHCVGIQVKFNDDLSRGFHDYGVLWTPNQLIFEVDGQPTAVVETPNVITGEANLRLATAIGDSFGKLTGSPIGHDMLVQSVRVTSL